jgi:long-chain acyl-CoA synthetase
MHRVQMRPKSAAFLFHGEAWTYEKIAAQSESLAQGMVTRGVRPGDRVALHMMNRPELILAEFKPYSHSKKESEPSHRSST